MSIWADNVRFAGVLGQAARSFCGPFCLLLVAIVHSMPASAADSPAPASGLDLLVLVDVSSSMYRVNPGEEGGRTDPERIRWDAVKLVTDLLTVEDRILIGRFNSLYPTPTYVKSTSPEHGYEGDDDGFPRELVQLTTLQRSNFEKLIAVFNTAPGDKNHDDQGHNDFGGTAIVETLQKVADKIQDTVPGRKAAVLLLTDGADLKEWNEEELRQNLARYAGTTSRSRVPIYCIGLGFANLGLEERRKANSLLSQIAKLSGGDFTTAKSNGELLEIFRRRIWNLKGCFYRHYQLRPSAAHSVHVKTAVSAGIVELGLLSFETDETRGPKNTSPPAEPLVKTWPQERKDLMAAAERGTWHCKVYDYFCYGKQSVSDGSPGAKDDEPVFAKLRKKPVCLNLTMRGDKLPQSLFISKRTADDLFRIDAPTVTADLYRYGSLAVRVTMLESPFFKPEEFRVKARIYSEGGAGQATATPLQETDVRRVPGQRLFEGRISLRELPPWTGDVTNYTLVVTVEGKLPEDDDCSADPFVLELPPRTIGVKNVLLLDPIAPIELTRKNPTATVQIKTRYDIDRDLPVQVNFTLPKRTDGTAVDEDIFSKGCVRARDVTLGGGAKKGTGQFSIELNPAHLPEGGVSYSPGQIEVTAKGLKVPITAELRLRIKLAQIAVKPDMLNLVAPKQEATPDLQIELAPGETPIGIDQLEVKLEPDGANGTADSTQSFSDKEIWIQKVSEPAPTPEQRKQLRRVGLNEAFRVHAHVADKPNKLYSFRLAVSGPSVDTVYCSLKLFIDPPELKLRETELTLHLSPDVEQSVKQNYRFWAKLDGLKGATDEAYFVGGGDATQISLKDAETGKARAITINSPGPQTPVKLAVSSKKSHEGSGEWTPFPFEVVIPPGMPCGVYNGEIAICGKRTTEQKLPLTLIIDALRVEVECHDEGQTNRWNPTDNVNLVQFFEYEMHKRLRIISQLKNARLAPSSLKVKVGGFLDGAGDSQPKPTHSEAAADGSTGAVIVDFHFGPVSSGDPEIPYHVPIDINYADHATKRVNFSVWFCRDAAFLSTDRSEKTAVTPSRSPEPDARPGDLRH